MDEELLYFTRELELPPGYALEAGACDGIFKSTTACLELLGWTVLCVEANPEYFPALQANRRLARSVALGGSRLEGDFHINDSAPASHSALAPHQPLHRTVRVQILPLDNVIEEAGFPRLDLLSLDLEGGEPDALIGFDPKRWQTRAIRVEMLWGEVKTERIHDWMGAHGFQQIRRAAGDGLWSRP